MTREEIEKTIERYKHMMENTENPAFFHSCQNAIKKYEAMLKGENYEATV